jgi:uncharacterized protein
MALVFGLVPLGLVAGALTTVAGLGGGLLLLLTLSAFWGPAAALAATAPALLLGNLHRLALFRKHVDWKTVRAFGIGALPGALVGGVLAARIPPLAVQLMMVGMTALAVARAVFRSELRVPPAAMTPAGFVIGTLTGAAGGAGVLVAPLLLSTGLSGSAYVATSAAAAVVMHFGRILGYGSEGLFTSDAVGHAAILAVAILGGNYLGKRLRPHVRESQSRWIEHGVLVVCVALALWGVT